MLTAHIVNTQHADVCRFVQGDLTACASRCDVPDAASAASLVFVKDAPQLAEVCLREPAIVVMLASARTERFPPNLRSCVFSVQNLPIAMAALLVYFDQKRARFTQWGQRHATAVVHDGARVGHDVHLGPFCVVGHGASLGDGCLIGAHAVVENNAIIGARTIIHPHVFIGAGCEIGSDCEIHPHTTIGSDGFGYAMDADGTPRKIRHLGNVVVGDNVEIGGCCAVDRATLTSTRIRSGTKLDNLCHIAHNCDLGKNGLYTAGFMMGGSTSIGSQFATGGNSVVTAHVTLGDNVTLAGRSTVTNDVPTAGAYGGYPLQPLHDAKKTTVNIGRLNEMRKDLNRVLKNLALDRTDRKK